MKSESFDSKPFNPFHPSDADSSQMLRAQQAFYHTVRLENLAISRLLLVLAWGSFHVSVWLAIFAKVSWLVVVFWLVLALLQAAFHTDISKVLA